MKCRVIRHLGDRESEDTGLSDMPVNIYQSVRCNTVADLNLIYRSSRVCYWKHWTTPVITGSLVKDGLSTPLHVMWARNSTVWLCRCLLMWRVYINLEIVWLRKDRLFMNDEWKVMLEWWNTCIVIGWRNWINPLRALVWSDSVPK